MDSLVVIREPVSRFLSAFDYAKFGSELTSPAIMRLRGKHTAEFRHFRTAGSFVDALAQPEGGNATPAATAAAWGGLVKREGGVAFRKQTQWLRNTSRVDATRLHLVCYDSQGIAMAVERVLQRIGSNCSVEALKRTINLTPKPNNTASERLRPERLMPNQSAWVRAQYTEDAALYRAVCEPHLPRLEIPTPLPRDPRWSPGFDPRSPHLNVGRVGWTIDRREEVDAILDSLPPPHPRLAAKAEKHEQAFAERLSNKAHGHGHRENADCDTPSSCSPGLPRTVEPTSEGEPHGDSPPSGAFSTILATIIPAD